MRENMQAAFEMTKTRVNSFIPSVTPEPPYRLTAALIDYVNAGLSSDLSYSGDSRLDSNIYGMGVLGVLPIRCAEVFRGEEDAFLDAFNDVRTADNTLFLLAKGDDLLAARIEEQYGMSLEYLSDKIRANCRLLHLEHDGSFFSLQLNHREILGRHKPETICAYRLFMRDTSQLFAFKLSQMGVLRSVIGKGL
jgi:hypothetical protein